MATAVVATSLFGVRLEIAVVIVIAQLERVATGSFVTIEFAVEPAVMFPQHATLEEANEHRLKVVEQECSVMLEQGWEVNQFEAQHVG